MQIFTTLDAGLQPVELTGATGALYWQRAGDGAYVRSDHQVGVADLAGWDDEALALNRVQAVTVANPPSGKVLAGYALQADDQGVITASPTWADVPPPPVPQVISRMQAQLELHATPSPSNAGKTLLDDVNAALAASSDPTLAIYWNTAADFHREHPKLNALATAMGLSSATVDALFQAASLLS